MSIEELRNTILKNDYSLFQKLYRSVKPYCLAGLRSKHSQLEKNDRESIYDDAIIIFKDKLLAGKIEDQGNIKAYISSVCQNLAMNQLRKDQRRKSKESEIRLLFHREGHIHSESDDINEALLRKVQAAIKQLGDKCKQIIILFYYQNDSMATIADKMGFSSKDVAKTSKSRCLAKLIKLVKNK